MNPKTVVHLRKVSRLWIFVRRHLCWQDVSGELNISHLFFTNLQLLDFSGTRITVDLNIFLVLALHHSNTLVYLDLENTQAAVRVVIVQVRKG